MGTRPFEDADDPTPRAAGSKPPPKPAAAPGKPAAKPAPPPTAQSVPNRVTWGHVGQVNFAEHLTDRTGRPGVIRIVAAGIHYRTPPLDRFVWHAAIEQPGRFEMVWSEGSPAEVQTLAHLGEELRRNTPPPRARLKALDQTAQTLLRLTQRLHEQDWRLGLLHPDNVLLVPGSNGDELVLPDLGYIWRGSHGEPPWKDSPGRPAWVEDDKTINRLARFWDAEPVFQQAVWAEDDILPQISETSDLRTLARIFAAVLTGRAEATLTPPRDAAPCWQVLQDVMAGRIATAEEFRTKLDANPLSGHWTHPVPSKSPAVPALVVILLLLGGVGLAIAAWQFGLFGPAEPTGTQVASAPKRTSVEPTAKATNVAIRPVRPNQPKKVETNWRDKPSSRPAGVPEFEALLKQFEATADPKKWIELLIQMYELYQRADDSTKNQIRPWIEYCRGRYVGDWARRYKETDAVVHKNIAARYEIGQKIFDLNQEMVGLRQKFEPISPSLDERENECLSISTLRATELGSRRSP